MIKILVFGTFDIFHEGHISFLNQARAHGDWLRVVIARDATVSRVKQCEAVNNETARLLVVQNSGLADEVVLGDSADMYKSIREFRPDVICLGYDQLFFVDKLKEKIQEFGLKTRIIKLESFKPEIYKSSKLKK